MARPSVEVTASIDNTPEAVMIYIADVRNRPFYLPSLKSVSDIKPNPSGPGTTWKWTWVALGMEFEGVGKCVKHEPGHLYSFQTKGGIASTWTYTAEPEGQGTKLTIHVDYEVPERARPRLPADKVGDAMKKTEADRVIQNLKVILDR
jgi:carbon monoxide dehydrogenase subunit G